MDTNHGIKLEILRRITKLAFGNYIEERDNILAQFGYRFKYRGVSFVHSKLTTRTADKHTPLPKEHWELFQPYFEYMHAMDDDMHVINSYIKKLFLHCKSYKHLAYAIPKQFHGEVGLSGVTPESTPELEKLVQVEERELLLDRLLMDQLE